MKGHITRVCTADKHTQKVKNRKEAKVHDLQRDDEFSDSSEELEISHLRVNCVGKDDVIWVTPVVEGIPVKMELDTGSAVTIISKEDYEEKFNTLKLQATDMRLRTYTGEKIKPLGVLRVTVEINNQREKLSLVVVDRGSTPLFGRDWLKVLKLNWKGIAQLSVNPDSRSVKDLSSVLQQYSEVFEKGIGTLEGIQARISIEDGVSPKFCKARPVPYALRPKVEAELEKLERDGILSKVDWAEWATPVVPVPKKDGSIRICGDFKLTINPVLRAEEYPLPRIEDIFAKLAGGTLFSVIDLAKAYHQMVIEEDSRQYVTLNTQKGLYQYNRLVFGIKSAPSIWQRAIDQVLQGLEGTQCYLDDILITGRTAAEHMKNLENVLARLKKFGLRANRDKCKFFQTSVSYLGYVLDKNGLNKAPDKIRAVVQAPRPQDVTSLRSYIGLVNYYNRFLPNLASTLHPLYQLLEKGRSWNWTSSCEQAFQECKKLVTSDQVLTHYDPGLPVRLACDASPYGIGAVLSHVMPDRTERPIAFASRSLSSAEQAYAQIDKEALALVWGVKHFNHYLYGRRFQLVTDHKPLTYIFHPERGIPGTAAARIQRWALFLSGHDYVIVYKNTAQHSNADCLSRLPMESQKADQHTRKDSAEIFNLNQIEILPVTMEKIERETRRDLILSEVYELTRQGWPTQTPAHLQEFQSRSHELSIHGHCIMWGIRVVIPKKYQRRVLDELHQGHIGVVKMKSLARSYVWWPGIDRDIENAVKSCPGCQLVQKAPALAPLHPWEWPSNPWERIHIDYAGPFMGSMFLVVVDAHSKWPEIFMTKGTTSAITVGVLRTLFARTGIPMQLVSDNAAYFVSEEFEGFMQANGIRHITSAPYHPSTNGLAERMVQTFKSALTAAKGSAPVQKKLDQFLMAYRNATHSTTNRSPAQMFYGRSLRNRLDLLKPDVRRKVLDKQTEQGKVRNKVNLREMHVGQTVLARDYRGSQKWTQAEVVSRDGMHYTVRVAPGMLWRRHIDQLLSSTAIIEDEETMTSDGRNEAYTAVTCQPEESIAPAAQGQEETNSSVPKGTPEVTDTIKTSGVRDNEQEVAMTPPTAQPSEQSAISSGTERRYPLRERKRRQLFQM